jgi:hypothetical protein
MSHIVKSLVQVALHFGRTPRTAQRWRRAGMPKTRGGYDLDQVDLWLRGRAYQGATLRQLEHDAQVQTLFELAVADLRRGLLRLCEGFITARGRTRARLIDRAVREILHGSARQQSLLEGEGGGALCLHEEKNR